MSYMKSGKVQRTSDPLHMIEKINLDPPMDHQSVGGYRNRYKCAI